MVGGELGSGIVWLTNEIDLGGETRPGLFVLAWCFRRVQDVSPRGHAIGNPRSLVHAAHMEY